MAEAAFITCSEQSVPAEEARHLQLWLDKGECKTLIRIVESKARACIAIATNASLKAALDAPLKLNVAEAQLQQARRYLDFLDILSKIKEQSEFSVTKWT